MHTKCWQLHSELSDQQNDFECSNVKFQMRAEIIRRITDPDTVDRSEKLKNLRETGKLQKQTDKRKRRYVNADLVCGFCNETVPLHQQDHLLQFCKGVGVTPVVPEGITDYAALARRAFAIGRLRLESNNVRLTGVTTPRRSRTSVWGDRPGESLSELNPRKKRPRLDFQTHLQN